MLSGEVRWFPVSESQAAAGQQTRLVEPDGTRVINTRHMTPAHEGTH